MKKLPRKITPDQLALLKAVTRETLDRACAAKFAQITRVEPPQLSNYGNAQKLESFVPIDVAVELCSDAGSVELFEVAVQMLGYRLVPDDSDDGTATITVSAISEQSRENGEAERAMLSLVDGDGNRCLHTVRTVKKELAEAKDRTAQNLRTVARMEQRLLRKVAS